MPKKVTTSDKATIPGLVIFDSLPDEGRVRLPVVRALFGVSSPTIWRWSKNGTLDPPCRIGGVTTWGAGGLRKKLLGVL